MKDRDKFTKFATVTVPYDDFQKALKAIEQSESDDPNDDKTLKANIDYLNALVRDVVSGEIKSPDLEEFYLFQTPLGKVILANIQDYKGV